MKTPAPPVDAPDPRDPPPGFVVRDELELICELTQRELNRYVIAGLPRQWHAASGQYVYPFALCMDWLLRIGAIADDTKPTTNESEVRQ